MKSYHKTNYQKYKPKLILLKLVHLLHQVPQPFLGVWQVYLFLMKNTLGSGAGVSTALVLGII